MPHVGHPLTGLAIGMATLPAVGEPRVRRVWLGACVLAACLPDLVAWKLRLAGLALPHNALSAPLPVAAASVLIVAWLRFGFGERRGAALLALPLATASHGLLDAINGGVPMLWPFSAVVLGADWLGLDAIEGWRRLAVEIALFAPLVAAAWLIGRRPRGAASAWRHPAQLVPLVPVAAFAVAQLLGRWEYQQGIDRLGGNEPEAAMAHFRAALRWQPLAHVDESLYYLADCHLRLGNDATAAAIYIRAAQADPRNPIMRFGLARVYLYAADPAYHRPDEGLRLMEQVHAESEPGPYREMVATVLARVRESQLP